MPDRPLQLETACQEMVDLREKFYADAALYGYPPQAIASFEAEWQQAYRPCEGTLLTTRQFNYELKNGPDTEFNAPIRRSIQSYVQLIGKEEAAPSVDLKAA